MNLQVVAVPVEKGAGALRGYARSADLHDEVSAGHMEDPGSPPSSTVEITVSSPPKTRQDNVEVALAGASAIVVSWIVAGERCVALSVNTSARKFNHPSRRSYSNRSSTTRGARR